MKKRYLRRKDVRTKPREACTSHPDVIKFVVFRASLCYAGEGGDGKGIASMEDAPFLKTTARGQASNDSTYFYMPYIILSPTYFRFFFFTRRSLRSKMKFFRFSFFIDSRIRANIVHESSSMWSVTTRRWRFAFFFRAFKENLINLSLFLSLSLSFSSLFLSLCVGKRRDNERLCERD